jgi:hypothetical protein
MRFTSKLIRGGLVALAAAPVFHYAASSQEATAKNTPASRFTADNKLQFPSELPRVDLPLRRRGMNYGRSASPNGPPVFDNVFVSPSAYQEFVETGCWPDQAVFVLEIRTAVSQGSITKRGQYQSDIVGLEVEVKDTKRLGEIQTAFCAYHQFDIRNTTCEYCGCEF